MNELRFDDLIADIAYQYVKELSLVKETYFTIKNLIFINIIINGIYIVESLLPTGFSPGERYI
jgi:hypothetical protein